MTFKEQDVNRDSDGKFGEKTGTAPAVALTHIRTRIERPLRDALDVINNPDFEVFPRAVQEAAIVAANDPEMNDEGAALVRELADGCEDWNFHGTSMRLRSALAHRDHAANPRAPLTDPYSMAFDPRTAPSLLRRISRDPTSDSALVQNDSAPDDVLGKILDRERQMDGVTYLSRDIAKHPNASAKTLTRVAENSWTDPTVRLNLAENVNTPTEVQGRLLHDPIRAVRAALVKATEPKPF